MPTNSDALSPITAGDPSAPETPNLILSASTSSFNIGSPVFSRDDSVSAEDTTVHLGTERRHAKLRTSSRASPPLKLTIPEFPRLQNAHWESLSKDESEDAQVGIAVCEGAGLELATHDQAAFASGNTGIGAGYFSPPTSPDAAPKRSHWSPTSSKFTPTTFVWRHKMVKERRSLQAMLIPSFLQSLHGSPSTASHERTSHEDDVRSQPAAGPSKLEGRSPADAGASSPPNRQRERRISFMGRRRSQTYTGSTTRMDVLPPVLPLTTNEESTSQPGQTGRASPPSGLISDDPFAFAPSSTASTSSSAFPSASSTTRHSLRSPPSSPPLSRSASMVSLVSSVASDASNSMPGTPTLLSPSRSFSPLGPVPEEAPSTPESHNTPLSTSESTMPVPAPPPPTPASPLNPNASSNVFSNRSSTHAVPNTMMFPSISSHQSLPPSFTRRLSPLQPAPVIPTRARPAHTRPAFAPRPSLPSLTTLAKMHMSGLTFPGRGGMGRKRRGRVGAWLPAEPWDLLEAEFENSSLAEEEIEGQEREEHENVEDDGIAQEEDKVTEKLRMGRARSKTLGEVSSTPFPPRSEFVKESQGHRFDQPGDELQRMSHDPSTMEGQGMSLEEQEVRFDVDEQQANHEEPLVEDGPDFEESTSLAYLAIEPHSEPHSEPFAGSRIESEDSSGTTHAHALSSGELKESKAEVERGAHISPNAVDGCVPGDRENDESKEIIEVARHSEIAVGRISLMLDGESGVDLSTMAQGTDGDVESHEHQQGLLEDSSQANERSNETGEEEVSIDETKLDQSLQNGPALATPIPTRANSSLGPAFNGVSAIPKHVLREVVPTSSSGSPLQRNSLGLTASPTPSRATLTPSPLGSVDFGLTLGTSPRFANHEIGRPDSVIFDPAFQFRDQELDISTDTVVDASGRTLEMGERRAGDMVYPASEEHRPDQVLDMSTPSESYTYVDRNSISPRDVSDDSSVSDIGLFDLEEWPLPVTVEHRDADSAQDFEHGAGATPGLVSSVSISTSLIPSRPNSQEEFPSPTSFLLSYSQEHESEHGAHAVLESRPSSLSRTSTAASSPIINRDDDNFGSFASFPSSSQTSYRRYRTSDGSSDGSVYSQNAAALNFGTDGLYSRTGTREPSPFSFDDEAHDDGLTTFTYVQSRFDDEGEDTSMLPPLSTLPEDDPVFTLTPSRSRERGGYASGFVHDYVPPPPSRVISRQPSTNASNSVASASPSLSLNSNLSSSMATQLSHSHSHSLSHHKSLSKSSSILHLHSNPASRGHSPAASLSFSPTPSTSKSFANTDSVGSGMFMMQQQSNGRRAHGYGSSIGSTELSVASGMHGSTSSTSGSALAASNTNSIASLRSQASSSFEKSARGRRQSSLAQLSLSSLRTRLVSPSASSPSLRESAGSNYGLLGISGDDKEKGRDDRLIEDRGQRMYLKYSPAFAAVRRERTMNTDTGGANIKDGVNVGEKGKESLENSGRYADLLEAFQEEVTTTATVPADANAKIAPKPTLALRRKASTIDKAPTEASSDPPSVSTPLPTFESGSSVGTLRPLVTKRSQTDMHRSLKSSASNRATPTNPPSDPLPSVPPSSSSRIPANVPTNGSDGIVSRARSSSDGNTRLKGMPATTLARAHTEASNSRGGRGGGGHDWNGRSIGNYRGGSDQPAGGHGRDGESSGSDYGRGLPGRGGRERDDGSRERERKYSAVPDPESTSSESEESESESDDYGQSSSGINGPLKSTSPLRLAPPAPLSISTRTPTRPASTSRPSSPSPVFNQLRNGRKGVFKPPTSATDTEQPTFTTQSSGKSSGEDDVPLARSIPGALQAQKSIRQQIRSLRDKRKKGREVIPPIPVEPQTSRMRGDPSSQYANMTEQLDRGRSLKMRPTISAPLTAMSSSQEAAIIAQRTMHSSQAMKVPAPATSLGQAIPRRPRAQTLSGHAGVPPDDLAKRLMRVQARDVDSTPSAPQRKGHSSRPSVEVGAAATLVARNAHSPQMPSQPFHAPVAAANDLHIPARTIRPMRSLQGIASPPAAAPTGPPPPPPGAVELRRRATTSRARPSQDSERLRSSGEDALFAHRSAAEVTPPVPPVPGLSRSASPSARDTVPHRSLVQLRVYLNDMQRFNVVEAALDTNAKEVMALVAQRGEERPSSSWMLYEVCNDFGMERPMRLFELVADVSGSWNKEKTSNCFMIKRSQFASSLANIPNRIPTRSGYVDYEAKKGKWSKRWLELREHGLWLSKREGKDDEFLCSLSVFDAYVVTRIHKSSKQFTFAVKSTDPITLFENKSDYLHVFSVPEDTGIAWLESIWLARSYILHQERHVLRNKSPGDASGIAGAALARSTTRKKPAQTFVSLSATGQAAQANPFEPGSLLGKRI